jgi:hypothetical protein
MDARMNRDVEKEAADVGEGSGSKTSIEVQLASGAKSPKDDFMILEASGSPDPTPEPTVKSRIVGNGESTKDDGSAEPSPTRDNTTWRPTIEYELNELRELCRLRLNMNKENAQEPTLKTLEGIIALLHTNNIARTRAKVLAHEMIFYMRGFPPEADTEEWKNRCKLYEAREYFHR